MPMNGLVDEAWSAKGFPDMWRKMLLVRIIHIVKPSSPGTAAHTILRLVVPNWFLKAATASAQQLIHG